MVNFQIEARRLYQILQGVTEGVKPAEVLRNLFRSLSLEEKKKIIMQETRELNLRVRLLNLLESEGLLTVRNIILANNQKALASINGMGPIFLNEIMDALEIYGIDIVDQEIVDLARSLH